MESFAVAAFYHFAPLANPAAVRDRVLEVAEAQALRGSVLLAREGINGTVAGSDAGVAAVLECLRSLDGFAAMRHQPSRAAGMPFARLKVRLKREIVALGQPGVDPTAKVGTYVAPQDWGALIAADDVALIDTRNDYEVSIGHFAGAIDPDTATFGDFPAWWAAHADQLKGKRIAMYCTGGIRCEKATSWLIGQGVGEVYHLDGGILRYLAEVPAEKSMWRGECYVFDGRVALGHGLTQGTHTACHACGRPVSARDRGIAGYEVGVSCPACRDEYSEDDRARFRMRHRQMAG